MGMVSSGARPLFLAAAASQRNVSVSAVPPAMIDANLALFLAVALSIISIGNFWGTAPQREMAFRRGDGMLSVNNRANRATNSANATSVGGSREQPEQEQQVRAGSCHLSVPTHCFHVDLHHSMHGYGGAHPVSCWVAWFGLTRDVACGPACRRSQRRPLLAS